MQALGAPERLAAALRGGWKAVADVSFRLAEDAGSVGVMQGVSENEMVVMLALRIEGEPAAQLRIVYPYIALEPFVPFME
jgi:flagellar motor switch protein FliM